MHGIEWFVASLPLIGLVALLVEIVLRDPHALVEMASDCETFARGRAARVRSANEVPMGLALHA